MAEATLVVQLQAEGAEATTAAVRGVHMAMDNAGGGALKMGAAMGVASAATTALVGVLGGLAHSAADAIGSVGGFASQLEQAGIAFTTMLHSGEKAQQFLGELQQFAAQTPFEFKDLVPAAQRMMAMGFAAETVIPLLTDVGNAAAGLGGSMTENVNHITLALGQMHTAGRLNAQDMLQLTSVGVPAWQILADAIGKTVAETKDMAEKGQITGDTMIQVFHEWAGANIGGLMEAQSHTFAGAMSTIRDVTMQTAEGALRPFFTTIRNGVDQLATVLQGDQFQTWAANVGEVIGRLGPLFGQLLGKIGELGPALQQFINDHIQDVVANLQTMGTWALETWDTLRSGAERVGQVWANITAPLSAVWAGLSQINDLSRRLTFSALDHLGEVLNGLGAGIQNNIIPVFADLFGRLSGADTSGVTGTLDTLQATLATFGQAAGEAWQTFQVAFVDAYNAVAPVLAQLGANIQTTLNEQVLPIVNTLRGAWEDFWQNAGPVLGAFWAVAAPILASLEALVGAALVGALQGFAESWGRAWAGFKEILGGLASILAPIADKVGGVFHDLALNLRVALKDAAPVVVAQAAELGEQTRNAIVRGAAPAAQEMQTAAEGMGDGLTHAGTAAQTATPPVVALGTAAATAGTHLGHAKTALEEYAAGLTQATKETDASVVASGRWGQQLEAFITGSLSKLPPAIAASVQALQNLGAGGVTPALQAIAQQMGIGFDQLLALIRDKGHQAFEAGAALGQQIQQGIQHGWTAEQGGTIDRFASFAPDALRAIKTQLQISSPSQTFADQVGKPLVQGIAAGARQAAPELTAALGNILQSSLGAATRAAGGAAQAGGAFFARTLGAQYGSGQGGGLIGPTNFGVGGPEDPRLAEVRRRLSSSAALAGFAAGPSDDLVRLFASLGLTEQGASNLAAATSAKNYGPAPQVGQFWNPALTRNQGFAYQQQMGAEGPPIPGDQGNEVTGGWEWKGWAGNGARPPTQFNAQTGQWLTPGQMAQLGDAASHTVDGVQQLSQSTDKLNIIWKDFEVGSGLAARQAHALGGDMEKVTQYLNEGAEQAAAMVQALRQNAANLRAGTLNVGGVTTPVGLTHAQIYGATATQGGTSTLATGPQVGTTYYGMPIVSPITPSLLRPMAEGGMVYGPTPALIGEAGPEAVIPLRDSSLGNISITLQFNGAVVGSDVRDRQFWEPLAPTILSVLRRRGAKV